MEIDSRNCYGFGPYSLDADKYILTKDGQSIQLTPKQFELLLLFVQNAGKVLRKDELLKTVWPDSYVEENNLTQTVFHLRRLLGDSETNEKLIQTIPRVGYRFVAVVKNGSDDQIEALPPRLKSDKRWIIISCCTVAFLGILLVWYLGLHRAKSSAAQVIRFQAATGNYTPLLGNLLEIAFSPDARQVVYKARLPDGGNQLVRRALDGEEAVPIRGSEGATTPFFSPDSQWIGFVSKDLKLQKASVHGGEPITLCDSVRPRGASWGPHGKIVFAAGGNATIYEVSESGGTPKIVAQPDVQRGESAYRWPQFLPDGDHFLFTVALQEGDSDNAKIAVMSLANKDRRTVLEAAAQARYVSTGHLVYVRSGIILAVPFDLANLSARHTSPISLASGVFKASSTAATQYDVTAGGSLVYFSGSPEGTPGTSQLVWVDRTGKLDPLPVPNKTFMWPRLSPDGSRATIIMQEGGRSDVWMFQVRDGKQTRLTFDENPKRAAIWTRDGKRITFNLAIQGPTDLYWTMADANTIPERLFDGTYNNNPISWSLDQKFLSFVKADPATGGSGDILMYSMTDRKTTPFAATKAAEGAGEFSPDGRWLAYVSNKSGREEIYLQQAAHPSRKWQLSRTGGREPKWAQNGEELFYRSGPNMMAVKIAWNPTVTPSEPQLLFSSDRLQISPIFEADYDVAKDGRFLMIMESQVQPRSIHFVLNSVNLY